MRFYKTVCSKNPNLDEIFDNSCIWYYWILPMYLLSGSTDKMCHSSKYWYQKNSQKECYYKYLPLSLFYKNFIKFIDNFHLIYFLIIISIFYDFLFNNYDLTNIIILLLSKLYRDLNEIWSFRGSLTAFKILRDVLNIIVYLFCKVYTI